MLGGMFLLLAVCVLAYGGARELAFWRRHGVPFKRTGEISLNPALADAKGRISTEGAIGGAKPLRAPLSGRACLFYEVRVLTRRMGRNVVVRVLRQGTGFWLDDGTGKLRVDASSGEVTADLVTSRDERCEGGARIRLGSLELELPPSPRPYRVEERLLPAEGNLFAVGKLIRGGLAATPADVLRLSRKGRGQLRGEVLATTRPSLVGGGLAMLASVALLVMPPRSVATPRCPKAIRGTVAGCEHQVQTAAGALFTWRVERPGDYQVQVTPPSGSELPLDPVVALSDAQGNVLLEREGGGPGESARLTRHLEPGEYQIRVRDYRRDEVPGGFAFSLDVQPGKAGEREGTLVGGGAGQPKP